MELNVRKILSGEVNELDISYTLDKSVLPEYDDVKYTDDIKVKGKFTNNGGHMSLSLLCSLKYTANCARCLSYVDGEFSIDFYKTVCNEGELQNQDDDDYAEIHDGTLDIDEAIIESVIINFPTKILCSEECKGLCPKCGINLNTGSCTCVTKEIDPRLAPLLKFFDNDDSEK